MAFQYKFDQFLLPLLRTTIKVGSTVACNDLIAIYLHTCPPFLVYEVLSEGPVSDKVLLPERAGTPGVDGQALAAPDVAAAEEVQRDGGGRGRQEEEQEKKTGEMKDLKQGFPRQW